MNSTIQTFEQPPSLSPETRAFFSHVSNQVSRIFSDQFKCIPALPTPVSNNHSSHTVLQLLARSTASCHTLSKLKARAFWVGPTADDVPLMICKCLVMESRFWPLFTCLDATIMSAKSPIQRLLTVLTQCTKPLGFPCC